MIYLRTKFHVPCSNLSVIIIMKGKAKESFGMAAMLLPCILSWTIDFALKIAVTCGVGTATLMIETGYSETSAFFYHPARSHIP
jgi:hypothetical protein